MKTMPIGSVLLATATIAWNGLHMPAHSVDQPAPAAQQVSQQVSQKRVLLSIEGMH